jgi:hypothetical protein
MDFSGFPIVGVAVFVFLTISAVAGMISAYKKRRLEMETLRAVVERGQPLDPALIERLLGKEKYEYEQQSPPEPLGFRIGGIVTTATGIGIALLAYFLFVVAPFAFYPVVGLGILVVCIGISLLICASVVERDRKSRARDQAGT